MRSRCLLPMLALLLPATVHADQDIPHRSGRRQSPVTS